MSQDQIQLKQILVMGHYGHYGHWSSKDSYLEKAFAVLPFLVTVFPHTKVGAVHLQEFYIFNQTMKGNDNNLTCAIKMFINKMTVKPWYIAHME